MNTPNKSNKVSSAPQVSPLAEFERNVHKLLNPEPYEVYYYQGVANAPPKCT